MHHRNDDIETATAQGAEAARDGLSERDNPYSLDDSVRFGAWLAGYISGNDTGKRIARA